MRLLYFFRSKLRATSNSNSINLVFLAEIIYMLNLWTKATLISGYLLSGLFYSACDKTWTGLDWKTWTGLIKHGVIKHGEDMD